MEARTGRDRVAPVGQVSRTSRKVDALDVEILEFYDSYFKEHGMGPTQYEVEDTIRAKYNRPCIERLGNYVVAKLIEKDPTLNEHGRKRERAYILTPSGEKNLALLRKRRLPTPEQLFATEGGAEEKELKLAKAILAKAAEADLKLKAESDKGKPSRNVPPRGVRGGAKTSKTIRRGDLPTKDQATLRAANKNKPRNASRGG